MIFSFQVVNFSMVYVLLEVSNIFHQHSRYWEFCWWSFRLETRIKGGKVTGHFMDVSKNSGTPKSSILIGFSIINHRFWGTVPLFLETPSLKKVHLSFETKTLWICFESTGSFRLESVVSSLGCSEDFQLNS